MAVSSIANTGNAVPVTDKDKVGFNGLTSDAFMKLLIAQLQNQDPTEPMGNDELLQQISSMRNLQANIELSDTLKTFSQNQQISTGAAFLGTKVTGTTSSNREVTGIADRVFVREGQTYLGIGTEEVAISKVTGVALG